MGGKRKTYIGLLCLLTLCVILLLRVNSLRRELMRAHTYNDIVSSRYIGKNTKDTFTQSTLRGSIRSFTANVSDIDVGRTELEQYRQFTKMDKVETRSFSTPAKYSYKVTLIANRPTTDGIFIRIDEHYNKHYTSGGSTFVITSKHTVTELCPYRDMFNGTYFVWCPPMTRGERRAIAVTLQYVGFAAFTSKRPSSFNKFVEHIDIRLDREPKTPQPLNQPAITSTLENYMNKKDVVMWYKENENWRIKLATGEHFFSLGTRQMCECVKGMGRLIMIGSSHMRYTFTYIARMCYNAQPPVLMEPVDRTIANMEYLATKFEGDFVDLTTRPIFSTPFRHNDVIFAQWGSHNLAFRGLSHTATTGLQTYVKALVAIRKKTQIIPSNFVVVTQPPFPYHETGSRCGGDRNIVCIAVITRLLKSMLAPHRFNVFDQFSILRPQSENDLCVAHYICPMFNGEFSKDYGDVGIPVARLMINHVCTKQETVPSE